MKIHTTCINIDTDILETFLLDDYRIFLKVQWLTHETILFYLKYILRFIRYSKLDKLDTFSN